MRFFSNIIAFNSSICAAEAPPPPGRLLGAAGALAAKIVKSIHLKKNIGFEAAKVMFRGQF